MTPEQANELYDLISSAEYQKTRDTNQAHQRAINAVIEQFINPTNTVDGEFKRIEDGGQERNEST